MRYNRHDYFRYTFKQPLPATFRIRLDDVGSKLSNEGECQLIDLSTGGAKIFSMLEFPDRAEPVILHLRFQIYERPIEVPGKIIWKQAFSHGFQYGCSFEMETKDLSEQIVHELKLLAKSERN